MAIVEKNNAFIQNKSLSVESADYVSLSCFISKS
jgi:hypothetical protein